MLLVMLKKFISLYYMYTLEYIWMFNSRIIRVDNNSQWKLQRFVKVFLSSRLDEKMINQFYFRKFAVCVRVFPEEL